MYYWDWTNTFLLSELFTRDRLGENVNGIVTGDLFSDDKWPQVCITPIDICNTSEYEQNSEGNLLELRRCPIDNETRQSVCDSAPWPTLSDVRRALNMETFDASPYNTSAENALCNFLEGNRLSVSISECRADDLCACGLIQDRLDTLCECEDEGGCEGNRAPRGSTLHNAVSIYSIIKHL